jgi:hypothetical protein
MNSITMPDQQTNSRAIIYKSLNIFFIDIGWMACISGAARGLHWLGPAAVSVFFVIHILFFEKNRTSTVIIVAAVSVGIGFFIDSGLIMLGTVEPQRWLMPYPLTSIWDLFIWANFSLALNSSLQFLQKRLFTAAVLGAAAAPGAYYAGSKLGALEFGEPVLRGLIWIGIVWFFAMPLLSLAARYFYRQKD